MAFQQVLSKTLVVIQENVPCPQVFTRHQIKRYFGIESVPDLQYISLVHKFIRLELK